MSNYELPTFNYSLKVMEDEKQISEERPSKFWNRVYAAVVVTTIVVVTLLWAFSRYFS